MQKNEHSYLVARAEKELDAAKKAAGAEASRAHSVLAGYYLDRAKVSARSNQEK